MQFSDLGLQSATIKHITSRKSLPIAFQVINLFIFNASFAYFQPTVRRRWSEKNKTNGTRVPCRRDCTQASMKASTLRIRHVVAVSFQIDLLLTQL